MQQVPRALEMVGVRVKLHHVTLGAGAMTIQDRRHQTVKAPTNGFARKYKSYHKSIQYD